MATHDYVIDNSTGANVRADINNALAAIVSNNSSSSQPTTRYAYMWWADTTTGILKIRNSANDGWVELLQLDGTLTLEDGTESLPGLSFRDDPNTGIFSAAADTINISTGGTERLQISSSESVFNDNGLDVDFRVEGDAKTHLLFVEAENDRVAIGHNDPVTLFHVDTGTTTTTAARFENDDNTAYSDSAEGHINSVLSLNSTTTTGQNDQSVGIQFNLTLAGQTGSIQEIAAVRTGSGAGALVFRTRNSSTGRTERFRIHSDGTCEIKDGDLKVASGHGIDFSATSGSGTSELLDDYEEGTFTPTNTIGLTLTNNETAHYTKIGRVVHIQLDCTFSGNADVSQCGIIQSLPFTSKSGCINEGSLQFYSNTSDAKLDHDDYNTRIFIGANESRIDIQNITNGTFQSRAFMVGRRFRIQMTYLTA